MSQPQKFSLLENSKSTTLKGMGSVAQGNLLPGWKIFKSSPRSIFSDFSSNFSRKPKKENPAEAGLSSVTD